MVSSSDDWVRTLDSHVPTLRLNHSATLPLACLLAIPAGSNIEQAEMNNYKSATAPAVRDQVEATLLEEIQEGNYIVTDKKPTIISALEAIPKPDSGEVRLIHNCSMPAGKGLNVYADIDHFSFQKLEDATKLLKPGYFMIKVDIRHAYRSIPIHRDNYRATGLKWRFKRGEEGPWHFSSSFPSHQADDGPPWL